MGKKHSNLAWKSTEAAKSYSCLAWTNPEMGKKHSSLTWASTEPCLQLLWMRRATHVYSTLSANIIREIRAYLVIPTFEPKLLSIRPTAIVYADFETEEFCSIVPSNEVLQGITETVLVMIGPAKVLASGGRRGGVPVSSAWILDGKATNVQMTTARTTHGVVYCERLNRVYAFGGVSDSRQPLASCEMLNVSSAQWRSIGEMHTAQPRLTPAFHCGVVYIAVVQAQDVDTYNVVTESFALVSLSETISVDDQTVFLSDSSSLFILSSATLTKVEVRTFIAAKHQRELAFINLSSDYNSYPKIIQDGKLYLLRPTADTKVSYLSMILDWKEDAIFSVKGQHV